MGNAENHALIAAGKVRKGYLGRWSRVYEFHRLIRGLRWRIFRMVWPVVPFHSGRQGEVAAVVIGAGLCFQGRFRQLHAHNLRAIRSGKVAALDADIGKNATIGLGKPGVIGREEVQDVKHCRPGGSRSGEARHSGSFRVSGPNADGVPRSHPHRPRVPEPVTGSCLPRRLPH